VLGVLLMAAWLLSGQGSATPDLLRPLR